MHKFSVLLLLLAVFVVGCGPVADSKEELVKKQIKVQNISLQSEVDADLTLSGTVVPKQHSLVRSLVPGTIEFLAPVGSQVFTGQPLFSIRDANIESGYFNALQSFEQTKIVTGQRVQQAELGLNSAKASLDLSRSQYDNTVAQTEQALRVAEDSAFVAYDSAYNSMTQVLLFLNNGSNLNRKEYIYENILTTQSQFRRQTKFMFDQAVASYLNIPLTPSDDLSQSLGDLQETLLLVKDAVDNTTILLQNALPLGSHEADRLTVIGYQTAINQHVSSVISSINSINNTKISNRLAVDGAQAQLDLSNIQYNNTDIALSNAKNSAVLELNMAQSQLDAMAYNYSNLTLAAPFSGTILSHFANPGEQVTLGQELIEVGDLSIVEITVDVDVDFADAIKLNDAVTIDHEFTGVVSEVEPVGDLASGKISVTVQSEEAEDDLVAGSIADVNFDLNYEVEDLIVIPIKAATIESTGTYVFVVEDGKVVHRDVTLGQIFSDKVSVNSGLAEGDQLILLNGVFIAVGDEVEIVE
ncbi:efflux RND transporter periplasmic adaptor subunit [bacterium]|nr:efflux RND transporter periplasmic adaptor subunit [bacterium]